MVVTTTNVVRVHLAATAELAQAAAVGPATTAVVMVPLEMLAVRAIVLSVVMEAVGMIQIGIESRTIMQITGC